MIIRWVGALVLSPCFGVLAWVAQETAQVSTGGALDSLLPALAGASPFAGLAMYVIVGQKSDLKQANDEKNALIKDVIDRVIPSQVESNRLHTDVLRALEAATVQSHQMAARSFDPVVMAEILQQLRRLRAPR